jgi:hypothetical protein
MLFRSMAARKKPERSRIATDPNRPLIERSLAMGVAMTQIGKRFGYSVPVISNYRNRMPPQLKAAIVAAALKPKEADLDKLRVDESEGILGNLAHQRARLLVCQDEAMEAGEIDPVIRLANTIHKNIELVGKYLGLFAQHHVSTKVNILVSEDYLHLRHVLTLALRPYPEARRAVADELHRLEGDIAAKMMAQSLKPPSNGNGHLLIDQTGELAQVPAGADALEG